MVVDLKSRWVARKFLLAGLIVTQAICPCFVVAQAPLGGTPVAVPAAAVAAGFVSSMSGVVMIRRGNGQFEPAKAGEMFGPGAIFSTGSQGTVVLLFADGQNITLGKDAELRIEDYRFDARNPRAGRASFGLVRGEMRFVTGAIHTDNRDALKVTAGSASVGILSKDTTAFVVEVDSKSQHLGSAAAIIGEIAIDTPKHIPVKVSTDQFTRWQAGESPSTAAPLSSAPAVFQATVTAARATITGSNLAIDVQAASFQAALAALPPTAAGQPLPPVVAPVAVILSSVTPGGGGTCTGSPC